MLRESDVRAERYFPPPVSALGRSERERLRSRLSAAVDAWEGAVETGLRLERLMEVEGADGLPPIDEAVEYVATDAGLSLALGPPLCGALVCASLGAPADLAERSLTETDLAILDHWAQRALRRVGRALGTEAVGGVARRAGVTRELLVRGGVIVGELAWPGADGAPAGRVGVEREMARSHEDNDTRRTLADTPGVLLGGVVKLDAIITGPSLPVRDLLGIEEGDVLLLGPKRRARAALGVDGAGLAAGRPGGKSGRRALRLTEITTTKRTETIDEWGSEDGI